MVQLILRLSVACDRRQETVTALRARQFPVQLDRRCAEVRLSSDVENQDCLLYTEEWPNLDDLIEEVGSDRFSRLLAIMETANAPPSLEFRFVTETRGLDLVAEARGQQAPKA